MTKYARLLCGKEEFYAIINDDNTFQKVSPSYFLDNYYVSKRKYKLNDNIKFLSPSKPTKIVCLGLNYKDHAEELKMEVPCEPIIFIKPSSSIVAHKENIIYPDCVKQLDYEGEVAVVIKKQAKNISPREVKNYILGYTCFNDVTARDLQKKDGQWTRAKSFDTFAPIGPYIVSGIDLENLSIQTILNGKIVQNSNTKSMIFTVDYVISFVSKIMTLYPGDIISLGTPAGVGPMKKGDTVTVKIENIGELTNFVK
ncbi:MAG: fumarylacetoacetate hydrolase family protein [Endomicrobiia bacterium]